MKKPKRKPLSSIQVILRRGSSIESIHNVHAALCDFKGRVLMRAGDVELQTFIRSAFKPFQALPFISSGTADKLNCGEKGIAICCGSHQGTILHARTAYNILWRSNIEINSLCCPTPKNKQSPLEHNCSGNHAGLLATCKKMNWSTDDYLRQNHPIHLEINRRVSELLGFPVDELVSERDNCGAPTLLLQLSQMALLYAHLGSARNAEFEQISRAMFSHPELVAGAGCFDTELMKYSHGQIISKGGSEGIQCISKYGDGMGIAIKVEDGARRAKHAVALHLLQQLDWITPIAKQEIENSTLTQPDGVKLEVHGALKFQEN